MIREFKESDFDRIIELFDLYRQFYDYPSDKDNAKIFLEERIKNKESIIYIAENNDGNIVGFVQLYPLFSSTRMKKIWLLNDLFVEQSNRGKGFSKALIQKAKELCIKTNACSLTLETSKLNNIGNNLYPKMGFELNKDTNFYHLNF